MENAKISTKKRRLGNGVKIKTVSTLFFTEKQRLVQVKTVLLPIFDFQCFYRSFLSILYRNLW